MEKAKSHHTKHLDPASMMLKDQHDEVKDLFKKFEAAKDAGEKQQISDQICTKLSLHSKLEQKTYYPTVKDKIDDPSMIDEGLEEHAMVDKAIHDLSRMDASNEAFEGHFKAMREAVEHHVEEEEKELFPMVAKTDINFEQLAQDMQRCMAELQSKPHGKGLNAHQ